MRRTARTSNPATLWRPRPRYAGVAAVGWAIRSPKEKVEDVLQDETEDWDAASRMLEALARHRALQPSRTTAMEILRRTGLEGDHRSMIAWLLNPAGNHGLGSTLLASLLRRTGRADLAEAPTLGSAVVAEEYDLPAFGDVPHRRADIVVWLADTALVIELKIHSEEHRKQTSDLASHFALHRDPHFVFLTLTGELAEHPRFVPFRLVALARDLREQLAAATSADGRATALDYLETLEGMNAVTPLDDARARFWIRQQKLDKKRAKQAAFELLEALPDRVEKSLDAICSELGPDVVRHTFDDHPLGSNGTEYTERVTLVLRHAWNGKPPLAGIGFGFRTVLEKDRDRLADGNEPFVGIWINLPEEKARWSRTVQRNQWSAWADWDYLNLAFDDADTDLPSLYAARVADHVRTLWQTSASWLDQAVGIQTGFPMPTGQQSGIATAAS